MNKLKIYNKILDKAYVEDKELNFIESFVCRMLSNEHGKEFDKAFIKQLNQECRQARGLK